MIVSLIRTWQFVITDLKEFVIKVAALTITLFRSKVSFDFGSKLK